MGPSLHICTLLHWHLFKIIVPDAVESRMRVRVWFSSYWSNWMSWSKNGTHEPFFYFASKGVCIQTKHGHYLNAGSPLRCLRKLSPAALSPASQVCLYLKFLLGQLTPGWCVAQYPHLPPSCLVPRWYLSTGLVRRASVVCSSACLQQQIKILALQWTTAWLQSSLSTVTAALDVLWLCSWGHITESCWSRPRDTDSFNLLWA